MRTLDWRPARGMAAAEFLLVAIPLVITGLGAFEMARWHMTRQAVGYALVEAARAGIVAHADPISIEAALQRGLLPIWGADGSAAGESRAHARLMAYGRKLLDDHGVAPWRIVRLSPTSAHFDDFARPAGAGRPRSIPNAYQHEHDARLRARGYPHGRGPRSNETLFAANTLTLRLTYLHAPLVPGMRHLLRQLGHLARDSHAADGMRHAGMLPITLQTSMMMQTDAFEWTADADALTGGRFPPAGGTGGGWNEGIADTGKNPEAQAANECRGWWCGPRATIADKTDAIDPPTAADGIAPDANHPACGVILCCGPAG